MAEGMGIENIARQRKQDVIFSILKAHARGGEHIYGDGVLEILQDGFGFLRSSATAPISRDRTTSTSRPRRSAASTCAPATPSPASSVRRRTASATSRC
jgi:transcription termination factor Rho